MSVYKFIAWTSPGLQQLMIEDLKRFNLKPQKFISTQFPSTTVVFHSTFSNIFPLMHYTSCITHLNLVINRQINARNHRDFIRNLGQMQLHAYLPTNKQIAVKCRVKSSSLNNQKLWKYNVEKYLQQYRRQRLLLQEKKEVLTLIEKNQSIEPAISQDEPKLEEEQFPIHLYIYHDKAQFVIQLHKDSLHKHGFKHYVGKAPIPENIAAALIQKSGILSQQKQDMVLWDPFCGSGTILFNYLQQSLKLPIRLNYKDGKTTHNIISNLVFSPFLNLPICPIEDYEKFIVEIKSKQLAEIPLQVYGCDILPFQVKQCFSNIEIFKRKFHLFQEQQYKAYPPYSHFRSYPNFDIVQMDYMAFYKNYLKGKNLFIISNPPWNQRIPFDNLKQFLSLAQRHTSLVLLSDAQWKQLDEQTREKWTILQEILQGGHWTKMIANKRCLATIKSENEIQVSMPQVEEEKNEQLEKLKKEELAIKKKLKDQLPIKVKAKDKALEYIEQNKKNAPKKKLKQIAESKRREMIRVERRNLNLKLQKIQREEKRVVIEKFKAEKKEKILDKRLNLSKLDDETKEKIQKKLNEKAKEKSQEILKKNSVHIPKW